MIHMGSLKKIVFGSTPVSGPFGDEPPGNPGGAQSGVILDCSREPFFGMPGIEFREPFEVRPWRREAIHPDGFRDRRGSVAPELEIGICKPRH